MTECTEKGCRYLRVICAICGRIVSSATVLDRKWIDWRDNQPTPDNSYLVFTTEGIKIAYAQIEYSDDYGEDRLVWDIKEAVQFWMSLPKPPEIT